MRRPGSWNGVSDMADFVAEAPGGRKSSSSRRCAWDGRSGLRSSTAPPFDLGHADLLTLFKQKLNLSPIASGQFGDPPRKELRPEF